MDIPAAVYPDFPQVTSLEELTLAMARLILSRQKDLNFNPDNKDYISISVDEEEETATVNLENLGCQIDNGNISVENYFSISSFQQGTGSYPFNQADLLSAFVHCTLYQNAIEVNRTTNLNEDIKYLEVNIAHEGWGSRYPLSLTINMTGIPITVSLVGGSSQSKGKPYLENLA
jgi:hypothetical protein